MLGVGYPVGDAEGTPVGAFVGTSVGAVGNVVNFPSVVILARTPPCSPDPRKQEGVS